MTGGYAGYALEGCDAIVVPVLGSSGEGNASDYKRLISGGFLLTWDPPPARKFFSRQIIFFMKFVAKLLERAVLINLLDLPHN